MENAIHKNRVGLWNEKRLICELSDLIDIN